MTLWLLECGVLCVFICHSKVDQVGWGFEIFVEPTLAPWCVMCLWWLHLAMQLSGWLFTAMRGGALASGTITSICKWMVAAAGLTTTVLSHSLHIGGAMAVMLAGMWCKQIMAISRWHSNAVNQYLHAFKVSQLGASTAILGAAL
jgi:hypothetical protein